ncbi:hypothetical protein P3X46_011436 [Hevea brasiliensis]|uniref:Uncharacterized protein n=1 Tax=Hevea brasiliensis TaxID=3981 RepID=A0ABQ9M728_HEVBR|nr:hypothetical protein P3X46_011436 [Hevea brasiliensis]
MDAKNKNQDLVVKNDNCEEKKKKQKAVTKVFETWNTRLDYLPEESLMDT